MESLFGLIQKQEEKVITPAVNENQAKAPALVPKESKFSGPFERKQSVK